MNNKSNESTTRQKKAKKHDKPDETNPVIQLNLSAPKRNFWLVKVPKYVAEKWEQAPSDMNVAKMRIFRHETKQTQVSVSLTPSCLNINPEKQIPSEHVFDLTTIQNQTLGIYSLTSEVDESNKENNSNNTTKSKTNVIGHLEGVVLNKMECRPQIADAVYIKLKLDEIRKASEPKRMTKLIDKPLNKFKPIKNHLENVEYINRKKAEKRIREDKEIVKAELFKAFEEHQYYHFKDLVKLTNQPVGYLKEILREICDYNVRPPHKFMWELKEHYRHYQEEDTESATKDNKN